MSFITYGRLFRRGAPNRNGAHCLAANGATRMPTNAVRTVP